MFLVILNSTNPIKFEHNDRVKKKKKTRSKIKQIIININEIKFEITLKQ